MIQNNVKFKNKNQLLIIQRINQFIFYQLAAMRQQEVNTNSSIHIPNFYEKHRQKKQFTIRKSMQQSLFSSARKQIVNSNKSDQFNQQLQKWLTKKQGQIPPNFSDWIIAESFPIKEPIFQYLQRQLQIHNRQNFRFIRQASVASCLRPSIFISKFTNYMSENSRQKVRILKTDFKEQKDDCLVEVFLLFSSYLQISINRRQNVQPQNLILAHFIFQQFRDLMMQRDPLAGQFIVQYLYFLTQINIKTSIVQIRNHLIKVIFEFIRLGDPYLFVIKTIRVFLDQYFESILPLFIGNPFFVDYIIDSFNLDYQMSDSFTVLNMVIKIPENSNFTNQKKIKVVGIIGHKLEHLIDERDIQAGLECLSTICKNPQLDFQQIFINYNFSRIIENSRTCKNNLIFLMQNMNLIISFYPSKVLYTKIVYESGFIRILIDKIGYYLQQDELALFIVILQEIVDIMYERFKHFNDKLNKNAVTQLLYATKLCMVSQNCMSKLSEFQNEIFIIGDQFPEEIPYLLQSENQY